MQRRFEPANVLRFFQHSKVLLNFRTFVIFLQTHHYQYRPTVEISKVHLFNHRKLDRDRTNDGRDVIKTLTFSIKITHSVS